MCGDLVSRPVGDVLGEARRLFEAGVKELLVASPDTSAYGVDVKYRTEFSDGRPVKTRMLDLCEQLGLLAEPFGAWVRLHYVYLYPHVDEVVPLMAERRVLPCLDVPFLHAHPDVLRRMRRPTSGEKNLDRLQWSREICPEIVVRSTSIAGFPGESEAEFETLLDFVREAQIDRAGCFAYSPVQGAQANDLPGALSAEVREERRARFMAVAEAVSAARLARRVGTTMQVLVDSAPALRRRAQLRRRARDRRPGHAAAAAEGLDATARRRVRARTGRRHARARPRRAAGLTAPDAARRRRCCCRNSARVRWPTTMRSVTGATEAQVKRRSGLVAAAGWTASMLAAFGSPSLIAADRPPKIGLLSLNRPEVAQPAIDLLFERLRVAGLTEGRDFEFDARYASGDAGRLDALAQQLVRTKPAVIVAGFGTITLLARATTSIPIVMWGVANPVESGLVKSLSQPGGNLTGVVWNPPEIGAKLIDVLKTAAPQVSRIALVWNPDAQGMYQFKDEVERGARSARVTVSYIDLRRPADFRPELLDAARPDALYVAWDPVVAAIAPRLVDYATARRLPSIGVLRQFVEMGGLMSLGPDPKEIVSVVASLVARILKGASPATLPIEQPRAYELIVNRKAAGAIGLHLPRELLLQAAEVIER
jgi:ABC-type uncharacterized transport system substrate-binding protein